MTFVLHVAHPRNLCELMQTKRHSTLVLLSRSQTLSFPELNAAYRYHNEKDG